MSDGARPTSRAAWDTRWRPQETTPKDPSTGALDGIDELLRAAGLRFADVRHLVHGTTLVTNAIIERDWDHALSSPRRARAGEWR